MKSDHDSALLCDFPGGDAGASVWACGLTALPDHDGAAPTPAAPFLSPMAGIRKVRKLRVKCHYYCTGTSAQVLPGRQARRPPALSVRPSSVLH